MCVRKKSKMSVNRDEAARTHVLCVCDDRETPLTHDFITVVRRLTSQFGTETT